MRITGYKRIDVVIDCVGAKSTISDSIRVISKGRATVVVGLFGSPCENPNYTLGN
jgi:threonine dehydrogenase-like Zn-dependent dehydrogenase